MNLRIARCSRPASPLEIRRRAYERCPGLGSAVAQECAAANRRQVEDGTWDVSHSRLADHKRTVVARPHVEADRTAAVDRSRVATHSHTVVAVAHNRGVGHSRVATGKHTAVAHSVVADRTRGAAYSGVAPHKHTAVAHNRVVAAPYPPLQPDQKISPRQEALPRWQSQCENGARRPLLDVLG
jgi:hypothetical protein